jgi:glycerophosphoryl diester phosphodiesterase
MRHNTLIYAHRGANREAAENTRTAFELALAYPIDGMETDVQLSRDGLAVLWHDDFLGKLGMPARRIDDYEYRELQAMDFAAHFGRGAKPEGIISLAAFVLAFRPSCRLLLEIKSRDSEEAGRREMKIIQTLALAGEVHNGNVLVSSFHLPSLVYAHQRAPDFPLVLNCESDQSVADAERLLDAHPYLYGLCLHKKTLAPDMVQMLRRKDKAIAVYTCNSDEEIHRALELGVDILITDLPQKALQMRDA